jgi:acetate---CoA ligase (ADP-forming)
MQRLFYPQSMVVVGVSEAEDNLGRNILGNLMNFGYRGRVFLVGPRGHEVLGVPIYRSIADIPEVVDLAIILTPARYIAEIMVECGEKGIHWAIIESGGFGESGAQGEVLQDKILEICSQYGIRFIGPNCIGIVHTALGIYTPFIPLPSGFKNGRVSGFAQSGGMSLSLGERLSSWGIGVNKLVSMGNKLSLDESDFLSFLLDDPDTSVIYFYLEDFKRGRTFIETALRSSKPIVLHKSNNSPLSRDIAQSHTAAIANDDAVVDGLCKEAGIVRVHSCTQATNALRGLSLQPLRGENLAVVSRSGGHAVVVADACARHGFHLPPFSERVIDRVRKLVRAGVIRLGNPLDLGDVYDLPSYLDVIESVLQEEHIHGAVFVHSWHGRIEGDIARRLLEAVHALSERYDKPVAEVVEVPFEELVVSQREATFPLFSDPVEAVEALALRRDYERSLEARKVRSASGTAPGFAAPVEAWVKTMEAEKRQPLLHESLDLLSRIQVEVADWTMTSGLTEAVEGANRMGYPVVLKAVASSLLHKTEKGALALNIGSPEELAREWLRLSALSDDIAGILLQKHIPSSRELIIGARRDPTFGPVVLVGFGGIMVEVLKDVSMRLAPVNQETALRMLGELSGAEILGPFRGMEPADLEAVGRTLVQVSRLMDRFPRITELDINPLSLDDKGRGVAALDCRILFSV